MTNETPEVQTTVHVPNGEYVGPDDPGYDRQVLRISRQITFTSVVPMTSYSDMNVPDAIAYEQELGLPEIIESLQFLDEQTPGQSLDVRSNIEVRRVVDSSPQNNA